jgi:diaminohydroxyphosphoribosylaminopyrimidine deaminase/5-amino-6-(5-phosphoribosylamino)uracil reductase
MVGCVIVKDGRVIGEGYHQQFGGPHAEPNALASCTESPEGATAYVTLEPCCHTNKKTPPCAPRLIEAKLGRVVIGCLDPNPDVNGKGVAVLRAAAIRVDGPLLEPEAKQLIAPFLARVNLRRPYVTLKWAQTADGRIAGPGGVRLQISNPMSMRLVHQLRARSDAILVGLRTVIADDPLLTSRGVEHARPMTRIVLDRDLAIPETARLVTTASETELVLFTSESAAARAKGKMATLTASGVKIVPVKEVDSSGFDLGALLQHVAELDRITHLLVEPGASLARSFVGTDHFDRLWVFRSPKVLGDPHAPRAVPVSLPETARIDLDGDLLTEYLNAHSAAFFAPAPSADIELARSESN